MHAERIRRGDGEGQGLVIHALQHENVVVGTGFFVQDGEFVQVFKARQTRREFDDAIFGNVDAASSGTFDFHGQTPLGRKKEGYSQRVVKICPDTEFF